MAVKHLVRASRLHQQWFFSRYYWQGVSDAVTLLIERSPSARERFQLALDRGARLRNPREFIPVPASAGQRAAFSAKCHALIDVGFVSGLLGAAGR